MSKHSKVKINYTRFFSVILGFALIIVLIVVGINFLTKPKTKTPEHTTSDLITSSPTETSSSEPEVIEVDYETRVGKEYKIDISKYLEYIEPEDDTEFTKLVNPQNTLASDYVPEDLTDCQYTRQDGRATQKLRRNAAMALQAFLGEAKEYGVTNVTVTSAYRSYDYQNYLFNLYCDQHQYKFKTREECEKYVLTFSTKPGTSEHQSGLCLDMHNLPSAEESFANTEEAKWLADNCYRFGFILRYPKDKTDITKITYEPWHFRFVGREAATVMHEKNMCLEEYTEWLANNK